MMTFLRFYWACLKQILVAAWGAISILSTLSTFAGLLLVGLKIMSPDSVNTLVIVLLFVIPVFALLIVPWTHAFRLYQEKASEVTAEKTRSTDERALLTKQHDEERQQWEKERLALQGEISAIRAKRLASDRALAELNKLIEDGHVLHSRIKGCPSKETQTWTQGEIDAWRVTAENLIKDTEPSFLGHFGNNAGLDEKVWGGLSWQQIGALNFLAHRLTRLGELHHRWSSAATQR
jgi:hypothetical protein